MAEKRLRPRAIPAILRPRNDPTDATRLAQSTVTTSGVMSTEDVVCWLERRRLAGKSCVLRIPLAELVGWRFDESTGNLEHSSGRFFSVEGYRVSVEGEVSEQWLQPILNQPEIAVLGLLVQEFNGILHVLMQAKMEPGNCNLIQLSPTVQATRSNYLKVHGGAAVRYLEYFTSQDRGRVIVDILQSEQGTWFDRKVNRNIIVEAKGDVPVHEDFCWLTFGQLGQLLQHDNIVNMDARTVLSCMPMSETGSAALHSDVELLAWFTGVRCRYAVRAERIPLSAVPHWTRDEVAIRHIEGRHFAVVAVSVNAESRETASWTQPLLEPCGEGIACFLTREFDGVPHYLVHASIEGGFVNAIELAPTVQCTSSDYKDPAARDRIPFLDAVLSANPKCIQYQAVQSEEGGRFLNAQTRYMVIGVTGREAPTVPPPDYFWVTRDQLTSLVKHSSYINIQARTLLACLNAMANSGV